GTLRSEAPGAGWVLPLLPSSQRGAGFMGPADGVARGAFAAPFLRWAISIRICCSVLSSNGRPGCSASPCCFMAKGTGLGGHGLVCVVDVYVVVVTVYGGDSCDIGGVVRDVVVVGDVRDVGDARIADVHVVKIIPAGSVGRNVRLAVAQGEPRDPAAAAETH